MVVGGGMVCGGTDDFFHTLQSGMLMVLDGIFSPEDFGRLNEDGNWIPNTVIEQLWSRLKEAEATLKNVVETDKRVCKRCNATNPFVGEVCPACGNTDLYVLVSKEQSSNTAKCVGYTCNSCGDTFSTASTAHDHVQRVHGEGSVRFNDGRNDNFHIIGPKHDGSKCGKVVRDAKQSRD
jgi:ribosomal protein L40E